ncbi:DUF6542 domain-containing protein [Streptomyces kronopolitis]|uniref:DUF6542 domain-containing protein n=1 Tax=Streptomyces kronopolitis TaxID=1612435 RepID=UPI0036C93F94
MAGQWGIAPETEEQPSPGHAISRHDTQRSSQVANAPYRKAGPRHKRAVRWNLRFGSRSGTNGGTRTALPVVVLPALGAAAGELTASSLGWTFTITAVVGTAWAAMHCSWKGFWWVACAPPLVVGAISVATGQFTGSTASAGSQMTSQAVHWAIDGFPAMAAAEISLIVVLAVRFLWFRRNRRNHGA